MNSTSKKGFYSMIDITFIVSESEIAALCPEYNAGWSETHLEDLKTALFNLGMDTNSNFELMPVCQHRNRFGKIVTCARYVGQERLDKEYLDSGYASREALDKAKNSPMLDCLYREKGLTVDAQMALERKDLFVTAVEDEEIY